MDNMNVWDMTIEALEAGGYEQIDFSMDSDGCPDELIGFSVKQTEDKEFEHIVTTYELGFVADDMGFPKPVCVERKNEATDFNNMRYWTTTEGVVHDKATLASLDRSAGGTSDWQDDQPFHSFYSAAKPSRVWVEAEHRFHVVVGYIAKHADNKPALERARKRFWQRYFAAKAQNILWLRPRDINAIKKLFDKLLKA